MPLTNDAKTTWNENKSKKKSEKCLEVFLFVVWMAEVEDLEGLGEGAQADSMNQ